MLESRWLICRICLKSENKKLYNIFEPISAEEIADLGTTLQDKIELCGDIKLHQQISLPNRICNRCVLLLRAAYKFRDLCQQSQNQLKQFITTLGQKDQHSENNIEINFDSDAEEQQAEAKEESENILNTETDDYMVEECVEQYETEDVAVAKDYNFIQEENEEVPEFIDENSSQYVLEEVDVKDFRNDDVEDEITTTYNYESADIIIEEQPKKTKKLKHINERKPAVKRKIKQSQDDGFNNIIYECEFCENTYTEKNKYTNHMKLHIKKKPHECEICKKRFTTTPQLSRHMNSHTGKRPYKCQYCDASFGDPSTKIKHERIHTNERPYKCNRCNKAFAYSNVLKIHIMTHTGEKPHTCEYCGKSFSQLHHKNAHEKRHIGVCNNSPDIEYMENEDDYKIEEII